jgi:hypothetical protein
MTGLFARLGLACLLILCGCNKSLFDNDNTTNAELAAASSLVGEAATAGTAAAGSRFFSLFESRTACSSIPFGDCTASNTKERAFSDAGGDTNPCTRNNGSRGRNFYGKATLTFSAASCGFAAADDTITRTLSNHYVQRGNNGMKVIAYTAAGTVSTATLTADDLKDYEGTTRAGGAVLKFVDATTRKLTITGIHRRSLLPNGKFGFWHTLYSDADAITVTKGDSDADPTLTLNGVMYLMHNRIKVKLTKTLTNLKFDKSCPYPVDGTIVFSGFSDSSTVSVDFAGTSCGDAKIGGVSGDLDENGAAS